MCFACGVRGVVASCAPPWPHGSCVHPRIVSLAFQAPGRLVLPPCLLLAAQVDFNAWYASELRLILQSSELTGMLAAIL